MSSDALNQLLYNYKESIDKKQRNLIKRKAKLDQYRGYMSQGQQLQADQAKALQNYEQVRSNITLLGEIIEHTNEFTKKMTDEIRDYDRSAQANALSSMAHAMSLQSLLKKIPFGHVHDALTREFGEQKSNFLKDLAISISSGEDSAVFPGANFKWDDFIAKSEFLEISQTLFKIVNPAESQELVMLNSRPTPFSYAETRDLLLAVMRNARVQATMHGKVLSEEPSPPMMSPEPEMLVSSESVKAEAVRFNFLHPSLVDQQQPVMFQVHEVENGQSDNQPWLDIQIAQPQPVTNGQQQERPTSGRQRHGGGGNRTHRGQRVTRVFPAGPGGNNGRTHSGRPFTAKQGEQQQPPRLTVH